MHHSWKENGDIKFSRKKVNVTKETLVQISVTNEGLAVWATV